MALGLKQDEDIAEAEATNCLATSDTSLTVKEAFRTWILDGRSRQHNPDGIVASWDNVSNQLLGRKLLSVPIWEITNKNVFQDIYKKAMNDKLFRVKDREIYTTFVQIGRLYLKFLKSKPVLHKAVCFKSTVDTEPTKPVADSNEQSNATLSRVDFSRPELCAQTRPVSCIINGQVVVPDKQCWSRLLISITERFIAENNPCLAELDRRPMYGSKVFFMSEEDSFGTCSKLSNGKWIYTNYNPQTIVTIIGSLCRYCSVALDDVTITYLTKKSDSGNERIVSLSTESNMKINDDVKVGVASVLEERFPNGIRPKSVIDINKLRNFYREATGEEIPSEIEICSLLNAVGIYHGDKVFAIPSNGKNGLIELLNRLIAEGHRVFYYDEFYDVYADYLQQIHIFSAELLRAILTSLLPSLYYSRAYFSVTSSESAESEVLRCYETAVCCSYDQLKEKLSYVPLDKIKLVLAQNSDYIWVNTGTYTHTSKLKIDKVEQRIIERRIEEEIAERGYVSLASIDVSNNLELNPELSETAVKHGLFQVCFADRYEKRGKIITPKGTMLNSVVLLGDYCSTHDRLTLDELLEFEKEINGRVHGQSLFIAYDTMIRVNKDTFVGDSEITFDTEATDNALALFVNTDVIPLQSVTSFISFPCIDGYPWNWYLLESYCKRFSKLFMYQCLSVNSRNVGAIFRKSAGFIDYIDVLATAVAASNIELNDKAVGDFLFESGYVARRTGVVSKVVIKARILRERRV
ncbi:hypothetical protein [Desulfotomaculum sp. 1211_IL3151]|uniref:hypothetical protein n=1 Tax=Desulfotomaculum sp. 1211_IL3151 TaxID=3084055 RepID=UPI002FDA2920